MLFHFTITDITSNACLLLRRDEVGVVKFVSGHALTQSKIPLIYPKATSPQHQRLSLFDENDEDAESLSVVTDHKNRSRNTYEIIEEGFTLDMPVLSDSDFNESPDIELKEIFKSLDDGLDRNADESETSKYQYIGVAEDSNLNLDLVTMIPKAKRMLPNKALIALDRGSPGNSGATKRAKPNNVKECMLHIPSTSLLSSFFLGPPMLQCIFSYDDESTATPDDDDANLDQQLGRELHTWNQAVENEQNETLVPLLTPPDSPLSIDLDGNPSTVCEWPSNLAIDSAMQAVNQLKPMSPSSLDTLAWNEQERNLSRIMIIANDPTTLTPQLKSVFVG